MRRLTMLVLLVSVAACDGPVLDAADLRLELVSGDGQEGRVSLTPASSDVAALTGADLLPEPIVARVTDAEGNVVLASLTAGGDGATLTPTEPSSARLPQGTLVRFDVPDGFGEAAIGYAVPDDSGYVRDRWVRGTVAGEADMTVMLLVGDSLVQSAVASATFLPGPAHIVFFVDPAPAGIESTLAPGETVDIRPLVSRAMDVHRNEIPLDSVYANATVEWAWTDRVQDSGGPRPTEPTDSGWEAVAPDWAAEGFVIVDGTYHPGLRIWVNRGIGNSGRNGVPFRGVDGD